MINGFNSVCLVDKAYGDRVHHGFNLLILSGYLQKKQCKISNMLNFLNFSGGCLTLHD